MGFESAGQAKPSPIRREGARGAEPFEEEMGQPHFLFGSLEFFFGRKRLAAWELLRTLEEFHEKGEGNHNGKAALDSPGPWFENTGGTPTEFRFGLESLFGISKGRSVPPDGFWWVRGPSTSSGTWTFLGRPCCKTGLLKRYISPPFETYGFSQQNKVGNHHVQVAMFRCFSCKDPCKSSPEMSYFQESNTRRYSISLSDERDTRISVSGKQQVWACFGQSTCDSCSPSNL